MSRKSTIWPINLTSQNVCVIFNHISSANGPTTICYSETQRRRRSKSKPKELVWQTTETPTFRLPRPFQKSSSDCWVEIKQSRQPRSQETVFGEILHTQLFNGSVRDVWAIIFSTLVRRELFFFRQKKSLVNINILRVDSLFPGTMLCQPHANTQSCSFESPRCCRIRWLKCQLWLYNKFLRPLHKLSHTVEGWGFKKKKKTFLQRIQIFLF